MNNLEEILRSFAAPVAMKSDGVTPLGEGSNFDDIRAAAAQQPHAPVSLEDRLRRLQAAADERGANVQWSIGPGGTLSAGERTAGAKIQQAQQPSSVWPGESLTPPAEVQQAVVQQNTWGKDPIAMFESETARIMEMKPEQQPFELAKLQGSVSEAIANIRKSTIAAAETEFRVPELKAALEDAIQMDNAAPGFRTKYGQTDSAETGAIREQYESALSSALSKVDNMLATNPVATKLDAMSRAFINDQERRADKRALAADKLGEVESIYGKGAMQLGALLAGTQDQTAAGQRVLKEYTNPNFKAVAVALTSGDSEMLLTLASDASNHHAKLAMVDVQAQRISGTSDKNTPEYKAAELQAKADHSLLTDMVRSDTVFRQKMAELYPNKEQLDKILTEYTATEGDASRKQDRQLMRTDMATKYFALKNSQDFHGNVSAWIGQVPEGTPLAEAITKAKGGNSEGVVSLDSLIAHINKLDPKVQSNARFALLAAAQAHVGKLNRGIYGGFMEDSDVEAYLNKSQAAAKAMQYREGSLAALASKGFGAWAEGMEEIGRGAATVAAYPGALLNSLFAEDITNPADLMRAANKRAAGASEWLLGKEENK